MPKFFTFKGFFSWIYKKKIAEERERQGARGKSRCGVVSIPVRLPLEGCMGQRGINTNNVHPDDFSIGLLDLFQLSTMSVRASDLIWVCSISGVPQEIPES
jgi:hypothetical protein